MLVVYVGDEVCVFVCGVCVCVGGGGGGGGDGRLLCNKIGYKFPVPPAMYYDKE